LLGEGLRFSSRTAVLLVRDGQLHVWDGRGWDADGTFAGVTITPPPGGVWSRLAEAKTGFVMAPSDAAVLSSRLESSLPQSAVALPVVLRDRVAAVFYADGGAEAMDLHALQLLTHAAAHAIEVLPFRERTETATLADLAHADEAAAPAAPASAPAPAGFRVEDEPELHAAPAAPAPAPAPAPEAEEPVAQEWSEWSHLDPAHLEAPVEHEAVQLPEPAAPAAPEPPYTTGRHDYELPPAPLGATTPIAAVPEPAPAAAELGPPPGGRLEFLDDSLAPSRHTTELPLPEVEESISPAPTAPAPEAPRPRPVAAPPAEPAEPATLAEPAEGSHETVLLPRPGARESLPSPWARSEAAESPKETTPVPTPDDAATARASTGTPYNEPAAGGFEPLRGPLASGTPEVRPPSGVQGPGWAFATTRVTTASNDEVAHEEARRLARLLVSEIKLYNEEQVEAGRRNRDIYERLREDIDRSRQMYEERVEPRLAKSTDYFYQELVRILAAGDSKALGI
jgi:hypothetical protein